MPGIARGVFRAVIRRGWPLLAFGTLLYDAYQPGAPGFGFDLTGWTQVCQVGFPGPPYGQNDRHWWFLATSSTSDLCGLGGQSFGTDFDNAPTTSSKNLLYGYRNQNLLPDANRFFIYEKWRRPANGPAPTPLVGRAYRFAPAVGRMPTHWPSDLPLPETYQIPNGRPAPTPTPTPYPVVPHMPSFDAEPGAQYWQRGYRLGRVVLGESHELSDDRAKPLPRPSPRPNPLTNPRNRVRQRERKKRAGSAAIAGVLRVMNNVTEANDKLSALYNALPRKIRGQVWREADGLVTPQVKARALWRYWRQIDLEEAFRQLVREEVTDWFYAAGGQRAGRFYGESTGSPFGYETGRHDDAIGDAVYEWYLEEKGHPPSGPGDIFDLLWPPGS